MRRAELVFHAALNGGGVWLTSVVLVEVVWVLRGSYKFDRATIAERLRKFLATKGVRVEDPDLGDRIAETQSRIWVRISQNLPGALSGSSPRDKLCSGRSFGVARQPCRTSRQVAKGQGRTPQDLLGAKYFTACEENLPAGRSMPVDESRERTSWELVAMSREGGSELLGGRLALMAGSRLPPGRS